MKKFLKRTAIFLAVIILGGYLYISFALPNVGKAEDLKITSTPAMLERGKYLAEHVMLCTDCHSLRDWNKYGGPFDHAKKGGGGEPFNEDMGFPGDFYSKNITPYNLNDWTDGEIFRAMTVGVSKDGEPLFPVMPYQNYAQMDREDLYAVIAYIRTLAPVENDVQNSSAAFPMNLIMRTIPQDVAVSNKRPSTDNKLAYGKYLFTAASCNECHSQRDKGEIIPELAMAGGYEFKLPNGDIVRSANLTSDKETGIGNWTTEQFLDKFRAFNDSVFTPTELQPHQVNTVMPWLRYSGMTEDDLTAIFVYLQSIEPIKNEVTKYTKGS